MRVQPFLQRKRILVSLLATLTACGSEAASLGTSTPEDTAGILLPTQGIYGLVPAAVGGVPSVIMLSPSEGSLGSRATKSSATIDQFGLTFSPRNLLTHSNASVTFTNSESDLTHNVRVRAFGDTVDVINADTNPGEQIVVQLSTTGGYDVICDMHPGMTAFIFTSEAARSVFAQADGSFVLDEVPEGTYTLQLWTAESGFQAPLSVEVGTGKTDIDLELVG